MITPNSEYLPVYFLTLWLGVTTLLGLLAGWYRLMLRFPNRVDEEPLLMLRSQSGQMNRLVGMNGVLKISVCPSGLRIGILRIFGPFCRDFFIPWDDLSVTRKTNIFGPQTTLQFGSPVLGSLSIKAHVELTLARACPDYWPDVAGVTHETKPDAFKNELVKWIGFTAMAAGFIMYVRSQTNAGEEDHDFLFIPLAFVALVFGIRSAYSYWTRTKHLRKN